MSEEAAFLAALRGNPADDTARLVYADWLDEHGAAVKAEYLRAVVSLTRLPGSSAEYVEIAARLFRASQATETNWKNAAGSRFDVVLESCDQNFKIHTIKVIRERSLFGLAEAKAMFESMPVPLFSWLPFEVAFTHLLAFASPVSQIYRSPIQASIRPTSWPDCAPGTVFNLEIHSAEFAHDNTAAVVGISRLLNITPEELATRFECLPLIVASALTPAKLADALRTFRINCHVGKALPPGTLRIVPQSPS